MSLYSFSHPPINLLAKFDIELQNLYFSILKENNLGMISKAMEIVKQRDYKFLDIKCDTSFLKCANLFRNGPLLSSAVANHLLKLMADNPLIFKEALWKRCLKICCLGSDSLPEVIAISKLFTSAQDWFWQATRKPMHLKVTVVNEHYSWIKIHKKIIEKLQQADSLFDSSKMILTYELIKQNYSDSLRVATQNALKEADIVMMVKFCSSMRHNFLDLHTLSIMHEISTCLKTNAVLFYLDSGTKQHLKLLAKSLEPTRTNTFRCIYGSKFSEPFMLTLDSIRHCFDLYCKVLNKNICLTSSAISSFAWLKLDSIETESMVGRNYHLATQTSCTSIQTLKPHIMKQMWREQSVQSQRSLKFFHKKVYNMIVLKKREAKMKSSKQTKAKIETYEFHDYVCTRIKDKVMFPNKPKARQIGLIEPTFNYLV